MGKLPKIKIPGLWFWKWAAILLAVAALINLGFIFLGSHNTFLVVLGIFSILLSAWVFGVSVFKEITNYAKGEEIED